MASSKSSSAFAVSSSASSQSGSANSASCMPQSYTHRMHLHKHRCMFTSTAASSQAPLHLHKHRCAYCGAPPRYGPDPSTRRARLSAGLLAGCCHSACAKGTPPLGIQMPIARPWPRRCARAYAFICACVCAFVSTRALEHRHVTFAPPRDLPCGSNESCQPPYHGANPCTQFRIHHAAMRACAEPGGRLPP